MSEEKHLPGELIDRFQVDIHDVLERFTGELNAGDIGSLLLVIGCSVLESHRVDQTDEEIKDIVTSSIKTGLKHGVETRRMRGEDGKG